jgi:hypothetical protein
MRACATGLLEVRRRASCRCGCGTEILLHRGYRSCSAGTGAGHIGGDEMRPQAERTKFGCSREETYKREKRRWVFMTEKVTNLLKTGRLDKPVLEMAYDADVLCRASYRRLAQYRRICEARSDSLCLRDWLFLHIRPPSVNKVLDSDAGKRNLERHGLFSARAILPMRVLK